MFVRWKKRQTRKGTVLYAVLVKSVRINNKPRQKFIIHLAHIKEKYLNATAHQEWFWARVDYCLDELLNLPNDVKEKIKEKLLKVVHKPTEEEILILRQEQEKLRRWDERFWRAISHYYRKRK